MVRVIGFFAAILTLCATADAAVVSSSYDFRKLTNVSAQNISSDLKLTISGDTIDAPGSGTNTVSFSFTFSSTSLSPGAVTDIYFRNLNGLLSDVDAGTGAGTSFTGAANPSTPPGLSPSMANNFAYETRPNPAEGSPYTGSLQPGETVTFIASLIGNNTITQFLAAFNAGNQQVAVLFDANNLRNDQSSQSLALSDSDTYVANVPEPTSMAMWGLGSIVGLVGFYRRKRALV